MFANAGLKRCGRFLQQFPEQTQRPPRDTAYCCLLTPAPGATATENKALGVPAAKVAPAVMDAAISFPSGDKKYSSFPSARHLGWDSSAC
jgi:hypothetical protein